MSQRGVAEQIMDALRSSSDPAMSAQQLAERLDVSVPTVNTHTEELREDERIETTQIGNAKAYYVPQDKTRTTTKHACKKCGRITDGYDSVFLEESRFFENEPDNGSIPDFYILCRFCHSDLTSWLWNDPGSMGIYQRVHSWEISDAQMEQVREDPEVPTAPSPDSLDGDKALMYEYIADEWEDGEGGVPKADIIEHAVQHGVTSERIAKMQLQNLHEQGHLWQRLEMFDITYAPAK